MSKFTFGSYNIRPTAENKFKPQSVKQLIKYVLNEELSSREYKVNEASIMTKQLSDILLQKLKELNLEKYKFIVHMFIGEQRGQGVKITSRCFWDCDTDNYVTETIITDSLICNATVYAVYNY